MPDNFFDNPAATTMVASTAVAASTGASATSTTSAVDALPSGYVDRFSLTSLQPTRNTTQHNTTQHNTHTHSFFDDKKKEAVVRGKKTQEELKADELDKQFKIFSEDVRADLEASNNANAHSRCSPVFLRSCFCFFFRQQVEVRDDSEV